MKYVPSESTTDRNSKAHGGKETSLAADPSGAAASLGLFFCYIEADITGGQLSKFNACFKLEF